MQLAGCEHVHAIACMVGGAAWRAGAAAMRRQDPDRIDIGLHLDLTECPLPPASPRGLATLIGASLARRLDHGSLLSQVRAQLDAFEQALGRAPAFVDGHQHVHQLPGVRDALIEELDRRGPAPRPWLRSTRRPRGAAGRGPRDWREIAKPWLIEALGACGLAGLAGPRGYPQNHHLLGIYGFQGGAPHYRELLRDWLRCAADGDLLLCHPSLEGPRSDTLLEARRAEFAVLASAEFATMLAAAQVNHCAMGPILAAIRAADEEGVKT